MRKLKGFTLIELLIVVVILGILATFVILTLSSATKKTRETRAKDSIKSVQNAMAIVAADKTDLTQLFTPKPASGGKVTLNSQNIKFIVDIDNNKLIGNVPLDGQDQPLVLKPYSDGNYEIIGKSASNATLCWKYSTLNGGNVGGTTPDAASCN